MKNKFWKVMIFTLLFAGACMGIFAGTMKLTASASAIDKTKVNVDYVNETITVDLYDPADATVDRTKVDEVIYFTETYHKDIAKWDVCEVRNGKAIFDISWVNENKTVRIYLCGDYNTDVISVDITWEENFDVAFTGTLLTTDITEADKWKKVYEKYPHFSEDTGYFIFTVEENGRDMSYFDVENIQWRKGDDGVWREYKDLDLKEMNIRGIGLEFRIVANQDDRASSTAKISVSKLMSAPVVSVNSNTMTVGIKNGMEFSFDKENWIMVPEYNKKFGTEDYLVEESVREAAIEKIYTNQRLTTLLMQEILKAQVPAFTMNTPMSKKNLEDFNKNGQVLELSEEGIVLYVRDIGTERKAASKIAEVIIPYAPEDKAIAKVDDLAFSYGDSKTNSGGIVVENKSDYKYQVGVITPEEWAEVKDSQDDVNLADMKWTSIKAGKMLKISNKKVPKGSYLVYRIAGEDDQLPSTYRIYGPMEYDHITYAGIADGTVAAGQTLTAVPSTNFTIKANGTYENLTFQWQTCADVKAATPVWTNVGTASNSPNYELTNAIANQYIRVVITDAHGNVKESDHKGPVKEVKDPAATP